MIAYDRFVIMFFVLKSTFKKNTNDYIKYFYEICGNENTFQNYKYITYINNI